LGIGVGAVTTAVVAHWSGGSWLAFMIVGGALIVLALGHGWVRPRLVDWRSRRQEEGYVKIVGGFKSARRRVIRYADGSEEVTTNAQGALVAVAALSGTGTVKYPTRWKRFRDRVTR
jgi:hypothetical protein